MMNSINVGIIFLIKKYSKHENPNYPDELGVWIYLVHVMTKSTDGKLIGLVQLPVIRTTKIDRKK